MHAVECIVECDNPDGTKHRIGDIIIHADAWMLCLHGFRNEAPRFKPADEETAAFVAAKITERQPVVDATRVYLQTKIDEVAASGKLLIDPATGFFKRDEAGGFGNIPKLAVHVLETAAAHGLKPKPLPVVVTVTAPAAVIAPTEPPVVEAVPQPATVAAAAVEPAVAAEPAVAVEPAVAAAEV